MFSYRKSFDFDRQTKVGKLKKTIKDYNLKMDTIDGTCFAIVKPY